MRRDGVERLNGVVTSRVLPSRVGMMMIGQLRLHLGTVHLHRADRSCAPISSALCQMVRWRELGEM